jgi:deoxycytidylate deaminase
MKIFPINYKYKTYQNKTANQNKEPSFNAKLRLSGDICRSQNSFSLIFDHIKSGYFKSDEWGKIIETFRMNHSDNIVELTIKQTRRQTRKCKYSDGIKFVYGKNRYKYKFVNLRTGQVRKYQFDSTEMCRECHAEENKIMELLDKINNDNYFWSYITPALNS